MLNNEERMRDNSAWSQIIAEVRDFEIMAYDFDLEETSIFEEKEVEKVKDIIREAYLSSTREGKEEYGSAIKRGYLLPPEEELFESFDKEFANA
ncbi:MAG: hypothetical protein PHU12_02790 [Candidatus Aenigmarchaeota archaeon]|nr:hypothetical protein [Candidatus Aenigmarchaeota archaeon]